MRQHAIVAAAIGGCTTGERDLTRDLLLTFEPDMLVIADRSFYSYQLWAEAAETGAQLLWRVSAPLKLPALKVHPNGSYRSVLIDTIERQQVRRARLRGQVCPLVRVAVRVIDYQRADRAGSGETVRLLTTIADLKLTQRRRTRRGLRAALEFEISLAELERVSAARAEYCARTTPTRCTKRSGPCCSSTTPSDT